MTQKILTCMLGLTIVFASLPLALAQNKANGSAPPLPDWQGLADVKPGKKIVVYTRQGKIFEGKFVDLNGSTLGLAFGFKILDFQQSEIAEVRQTSSRKKGRIVGAIIGTLAGVILAAGVTSKLEENLQAPQEANALGAGMLGMVGGGSLGYAIGLRFDNKGKGKLLYKSP